MRTMPAQMRHNKCQKLFQALIANEGHRVPPDTIEQLRNYYDARDGHGGSKVELSGLTRIMHEAFMTRVDLEERRYPLEHCYSLMNRLVSMSYYDEVPDGQRFISI